MKGGASMHLICILIILAQIFGTSATLRVQWQIHVQDFSEGNSYYKSVREILKATPAVLKPRHLGPVSMLYRESSCQPSCF